MSGLAVFLKKQGHKVSGCDKEKTREMREPEKEGIKIYIGHAKSHLKDAEMVVYTSAIVKGSAGWQELEEARKSGLKTLKRAAMIGKISRDFFTLTVSGTHGKTTTSAMIAKILLDNNFDPSFMLGAAIGGIGSQRLGKGEYLVLEADEYDRSFLQFKSNLAVILNIDRDHLDYFQNGIGEIKETFREFIEKNIVFKGTLVYFQDDNNLKEVVANLRRTDLKLVSFSSKEAKDVPPLQIPGDFNRLNALAATKATREIGISRENIYSSLKNYSGVERRFEKKGERGGILVIDDYAHHPTAIRKTIAAARKKFKKRRLIVVFQALHYSRTKLLLPEFSRAFRKADLVIVTKICYGEGREKLGRISEEKLAAAIKKGSKVKVRVILSFAGVVTWLKKETKRGDIVITMGAYPVREVGERFLNLN